MDPGKVTIMTITPLRQLGACLFQDGQCSCVLLDFVQIRFRLQEVTQILERFCQPKMNRKRSLLILTQLAMQIQLSITDGWVLQKQLLLFRMNSFRLLTGQIKATIPHNHTGRGCHHPLQYSYLL